jgi:hypothetical protein
MRQIGSDSVTHGSGRWESGRGLRWEGRRSVSHHDNVPRGSVLTPVLPIPE